MVAVSTTTSQAVVLAAVTGRIENRRVRAWSFAMDGHEFYVLRLGQNATVVCDVSTGQWSEWNSHDEAFFAGQSGFNWQGMGPSTFNAYGQRNTIVAGDDNLGLLWLLDPDQGYDEDKGDGSAFAFTRVVVGGLPIANRNTHPVGAVYLSASIGEPSIVGSTITLRTSDDEGNSWTTHNTITATTDQSEEFVWRSLGIIKAPGRIFEITDNGATQRIDGMDMQ